MFSPCSDRRRTAGRSDAHPKGRSGAENLNGAKRREGCADGLPCDDGSAKGVRKIILGVSEANAAAYCCSSG